MPRRLRFALWTSLFVLCLAPGCGAESTDPATASGAASAAPTAAPAVTTAPATMTAAVSDKPLEERNAELLTKHTELWKMMGLSEKASAELNGIVTKVNTAIYENKGKKPEEFAKAMEVKRADHPLTHDEYLASHVKRFTMLGISPETQKELLAGVEFVWSALHDPKASFTPDQIKVAETIRDMMKGMGGPPPCCDDNIFARAGAPH